MTKPNGTIISKETVVEGEIKAPNASIEVYGIINGGVEIRSLEVHEGGKVIGAVEATNIDAKGLLQGEISVSGTLDIGESGAVLGDVRYGQLALREGGELSASVRNIPPTLTGDMKMTVANGKAVRLTIDDVTAIDPDDDAEDLTFKVSDMRNGFVVHSDQPKVAAKNFTLAELEKGDIIFVHDGKSSNHASFAVSVTDAAGATSGPPRTVEVEVTR